ncbi:MAG: hypothetical protein JWM28_1008 [Chitinophagaceae bacterium]|nr:hypothetical protein [Chitinophagaceae bacterium]
MLTDVLMRSFRVVILPNFRQKKLVNLIDLSTMFVT